MSHAFASTLKSFKTASGRSGSYYSLPELAKAYPNVSRLPVSMRIVLESVLRNCDGKKVTPEHVVEVAGWKAKAPRLDEIPFVVARVVLQDFTGVPLLADLAAMRTVAKAMGKDAKSIEPLVPVDLVVDHSIMIDYFGSKKALDLNMKLEFKRNLERYQFMKWGMQAFDTFGVVPPGFGIVHQVNLEYLARGVHKGAVARGQPAVYYPDSLVGTDSHTTMINGIGVVGWGVGGIEAEAAMLGQPVYFLTPDVVGFEFSGRLREGVTATDLVLAVTEILRKEKVVGKFVEFFGAGTESLSVPDRATMANMAPEYGATMGFFPVDDKTIEYFEGTGRTKSEIEFFQADDPATMKERYFELLSDAVKLPVNAESYLDDIDGSFYVTGYLRSWAFEAQLREFLRSELGNDWFAKRDAGDLLRELWSLGQGPTADELLRDVTGAKLEMASVAERIREGLGS